MDTVQYGKIQGFLLALETFNNDLLGPDESCSFTFLHVPAKGALSKSLVAHIQARSWKSSPSSVWRGKPELEPLTNGESVLSLALAAHLYWVSPPTVTMASSQVTILMQMLSEFFDSQEPRIWRLKWVTKKGGEAYHQAGAFPSDWVLEHPESGEWFHLSLVFDV